MPSALRNYRFLSVLTGTLLSIASAFQPTPDAFRQLLSQPLKISIPHQDAAFQSVKAPSTWARSMSSSSSSSVDRFDQELINNDPSTENLLRPQAMASGYSQAMDMTEAIQQAVAMAIEALPSISKATNDDGAQIDLAIVSVSSLYDGSASPATVVPAVLQAANCYGKGIQHLIGSTCGGLISSRPIMQPTTDTLSESDKEANEVDDDSDDTSSRSRMCVPVEQEGVPGVSVALCILPDVSLQTFHVAGDDVPDNYARLSSEDWRNSIGLSDKDASPQNANKQSTQEHDSQAVFLIPSPAFSNDLDDLLRGFDMHLPRSTVFGAIASTVSSLSRARLFRHDAKIAETSMIQTHADGCVGVVMKGDIQVKTMIAQGAKPVGGVYQIVKGQESTISAIALDEASSEIVRQAELLEGVNEDEDLDNIEYTGASQMAQAYAKARIPKPALAEANFLMKTLSDDDQAFMRKALLVGLDQGGSLGRTPSELARLAEGKGHNFAVYQVASASMKDGSVTFPLGSVRIEQGSRMRFFVRDSTFSKKEVEAIWTGYKKRILSATVQGHKQDFYPAGCLMFPTLDRGNKFFQGKSGFESTTISQYIPTIPSIYGFFCNGIIGSLSSDNDANGASKTSLHGSASTYILIGSKSNRPTFHPANDSLDVKSDQSLPGDTSDEKSSISQAYVDVEKRAPRDSKGELILKRREVHSGRALTVSTVEWSVAEKAALPSSALEGFMWDKETEVDRFRERVPLANLLSQCKLSALDPSKPMPRDLIGPLKEAFKEGYFVVIPECKRTDPSSGSLRKRYNLQNLVSEFVSKGALVLSVNCDGVLFGGSLDDVTKAREYTSSIALEASPLENMSIPPAILASDLILYPYQLYKLRLAGADAVTLLVGSLATKDLVYLIKIAKSVQMQSLLTVTSTAQLENLNQSVAAGSVDGLIVSNRNLEDYSFDMTGLQALSILQSEEMKTFRNIHSETPILVEGRVGLIQAKGKDGESSPKAYIIQLKEAGAAGAIVGGGLVSGPSGEKSWFQSFKF
ncbi:indole-3-glycerol phosphate synthase [Nitzschia inconspicua]|uniref:Indole-3-glycerol phosphate synthase n=1 Tax=Nitzschia inconspicua TaxID=303405 RepID=A0A9K3PRI9_9STRA|nr:indole-3-glycerol phosphate synthase [Nitzschia inconspicua]